MNGSVNVDGRICACCFTGGRTHRRKKYWRNIMLNLAASLIKIAHHTNRSEMVKNMTSFWWCSGLHSTRISNPIEYIPSVARRSLREISVAHQGIKRLGLRINLRTERTNDTNGINEPLNIFFYLDLLEINHIRKLVVRNLIYTEVSL